MVTKDQSTNALSLVDVNFSVKVDLAMSVQVTWTKILRLFSDKAFRFRTPLHGHLPLPVSLLYFLLLCLQPFNMTQG
jgi:hypothetical protein